MLQFSLVFIVFYHHLTGYTKVTWYGFAGWGILKYFLEFPMRLTLNQAFFANQNLLMHYLSQKKQSNNDSEEEKFDLEGLEYDSDIFMVYGDPLTECRIENEQEDPFYKISLVINFFYVVYSNELRKRKRKMNTFLK